VLKEDKAHTRGIKLDTEPFGCSGNDPSGSCIRVTSVHHAVNVCILSMDGIDRAPQHPFTPTACIAIWMEERNRSPPLLDARIDLLHNNQPASIKS
jgi:hypothetical protein